MNSQKKEIEEKKKLLYTYWHELPYFNTMELKNYTQVNESEVRSFIIQYIRAGIEDEFGKKHNLLRRHAFTAKELHTAYSEEKRNKKEQEYSLSNFHFHIKGLVEDGYLEEIAKILEGRHYITYYGRTAKSFVGQYDNILTESSIQKMFGPLKDLIKEMNPELESESINQLVDDSILSMQDFYFRFFSWVEDKYPQLYKAKVDLRVFLNIAGHYSFFHKEFGKLSEKIGKLLDLDQINSYERYQFENE